MARSDTMLFDEASYLACNPDVQRAVASGQFPSGFAHFMQFGRHEKRSGVTFDPLSNADTLPHPPEHLRLRVHGSRELDAYLALGRTIAHHLDQLLADGVIALPERPRVLDFGCGPGRVLTWLKLQHPDWRLTGTDIDAEAIAWARGALRDVAIFDCNQPSPPLSHADATFDFVYSISIFTHLPEDMQSRWLHELSRVTRPGGYAVLTTHGTHLLPTRRRFGILPSPAALASAKGFYYSVGPGTDGLPDFYQTSYQTRAYIERVWSQHFAIEKIVPRGLAAHQDIVICRKRS